MDGCACAIAATVAPAPLCRAADAESFERRRGGKQGRTVVGPRTMQAQPGTLGAGPMNLQGGDWRRKFQALKDAQGAGEARGEGVVMAGGCWVGVVWGGVGDAVMGAVLWRVLSCCRSCRCLCGHAVAFADLCCVSLQSRVTMRGRPRRRLRGSRGWVALPQGTRTAAMRARRQPPPTCPPPR